MRHLLFIACLLCLFGPAAVRAEGPACPAVPPGAAAVAHLPRAAQHADRLDILALGSASTLGPGGKQQGSVADLLRQDLAGLMPRRAVTLRLFGKRGGTAAEMLGEIRASLAAASTSLVLWQTGTVEAVRRMPPAEFQAALAEGLRSAHDAGVDVILIDPPYSRRMGEKLDMRPYRAALLQAAEAGGAAVFDRFALMRGWAETGQFDLDRTSRKDRPAAMARLHECLAGALARQIVAALAPTSP